MSLTVAALFARVGLSGADQTVRGLQRVSGQVDKTGRKMGGLGSTAGRMAGGLTKVGAVAGGAVVTGLVASAKAAIDYESAFAGVRKTVDATEPQLQSLSADFRALSTEIPISAVRLAQLGETAGALGIGSGQANPVGAIKEFVRVTALLGETTDVSADQAATSLGQLGNVLKLRQADYEKFGSTLVDLGNKGASTESQILEIASRAGGLAHAAGFSADEILGWSSAVANLGMNNELAGSSIQRFIGKAIEGIGKGGKSLEAWGATAGMTAKEFKKAFEKDASGALEAFVAGLAKMPVEERTARLNELGLKGIGLTTMFSGLTNNVDNLTTSLDISGTAWEANSALQAEAQKRFDTVSSAISVLKNTIADAAIEVGTGMLPGIKRFTQETVGFIKANRGEIKQLGAEVGSTLEGIKWRPILDGAKEFAGQLKGAADVALTILGTLNKLPTEVKAAGLGIIGLDKITGGAVGDIAGGVVGGIGGGLVKGAAARVPGLGSLVATPVRVVNWPVGGLGGAGGGVAGAAGGAAGKLEKGLAALSMVGSALAVFETQQAVSAGNSAAAAGVRQTSTVMLAGSPTTADLLSAMRATEQGIRDIEANPLNVFVRGDAIEQLKATRAQIAQKLAQTSLQEQRSGERNTNRTTAQLSGIKRDQARHASTLRRAGAATALAAQRAGERSAGATRSGLLGVRGRLDESVRLERRILAKKRDIAITIKPGTTSVRLDGRKIASAMTKYGPAVQRHL